MAYTVAMPVQSMSIYRPRQTVFRFPTQRMDTVISRRINYAGPKTPNAIQGTSGFSGQLWPRGNN